MTISSEKILKKTKAIVTLTATLMSTTAIATSPAIADSYKAFPGSMCQHSTSTDLPKLVRGPNYVYNSSTSYAYVACPIVRGVPGDDEGTTTGPYTTVYVLKNYNNQTVTCTLSGYWSDSGGASSQSASTSTQGMSSMSTARVAKRNIYGLFCSLAPHSGIYSYYSFFK
ncbi:hypothetical protein ABN584_01975 [Gloeocapsa sp. BRSZ]